MQLPTQLKITRLPKLNLLVIKQTDEKGFFISTPNSIIISVSSLAFILKFLVTNDIMSFKVLEGILEEYNSLGPKESYKGVTYVEDTEN
jgi:hypothetical protein